MSSLTINITLDRSDITYKAGDKVSGIVTLSANRSISHGGVSLVAEGRIELQASARSQGLFDSFYSSKPIMTMQYSIPLVQPGKLVMGNTKLPFEFVLRANDPNSLPVVAGNSSSSSSSSSSGANNVGFTGRLYETYHGVYINVTYGVTCNVIRGMMSRDEAYSQEFVVHCPTSFKSGNIDAHRLEFRLSPKSLLNYRVSSVDLFSHLSKFLTLG
eukprot:TRINITY_DN5774_c0_g3_i1.p1 TRINITY_DN5774_c0_g3~~TRINITY_DN5774_c0_g3_i1.p1  ORF type:complete len:215 (-),score=54.42 TRINITY_DN5774_c0_g3_i1:459-1103(-)